MIILGKKVSDKIDLFSLIGDFNKRQKLSFLKLIFFVERNDENSLIKHIQRFFVPKNSLYLPVFWRYLSLVDGYDFFMKIYNNIKHEIVFDISRQDKIINILTNNFKRDQIIDFVLNQLNDSKENIFLEKNRQLFEFMLRLCGKIKNKDLQKELYIEGKDILLAVFDKQIDKLEVPPQNYFKFKNSGFKHDLVVAKLVYFFPPLCKEELIVNVDQLAHAMQQALQKVPVALSSVDGKIVSASPNLMNKEDIDIIMVRLSYFRERVNESNYLNELAYLLRVTEELSFGS